MVVSADTTLSEPGETTIRLKQSRQTISQIGQVYNRWFKLPRSVKHSLVSESFPLDLYLPWPGPLVDIGDATIR
jgi:hypothetical protein